MKRFFVSCLLAGLVAAGTACAADPEPKAAEMKTDDDKTFYALGLDLSNKLAILKMSPAELEFVKAGLTDGTLNKTPKVDLATFGPKINTLAQARQTAVAADEKKKGKAYLETIAAKPKVTKTASGLLMETISEGTGKSPSATDKVNKCWTEGLQLMKTGGKAKLYCPSEIAYGDHATGEIPAGAALVFEVELLEILAPDKK